MVYYINQTYSNQQIATLTPNEPYN